MTKHEEMDMEIETWGTWEELLLACAVNRHGTKSWDSIAMEIQNRSSSLHFLTAQNCRKKFNDLKRRFMAVGDKTNESESDDEKANIPWLDELKNLRLAELRREVQRYDVSIVSLQLKVRRLKEEREQSLREEENRDEKPDLEKNIIRAKDEIKEGDREPEESSPENLAGERVSGEESNRDNQSFNESNSTDPKNEKRETGVEEEKKREPVETGHSEPDTVCIGSKEGSYNGSSDAEAKESANLPEGEPSGTIPVREAGDSPELCESVAESKGGGDLEKKEISDVQSSEILSNKNRRKRSSSGGSSGEKRDMDAFPAIKLKSVKSQPLVGLLEIIRSHKYGSVFERRLEIQEKTKYKSLIRQHVDLGSIRMKLEKGNYSAFPRKFYRDLLLLFNNAIIFFSKNSSESMAAIELRELVKKEMRDRNRKSVSQLNELIPPLNIPPRLKSDPEPFEPLLLKPKSSVACGKRSSLPAKASSSSQIEKKVEQKVALINKKPVLERTRLDDSPRNAIEEQSITKKRTRERSRSSRANQKNRISNNPSKNSKPDSTKNPSPISNPVKKSEVPNDESEPKTEKKNETTVAKKQSVANFLNRMKRNSSSNGTLMETFKNSVNSNRKSDGGGMEQKRSGVKSDGGGMEQKRSGVKSDGRKEQVFRQSSAGKQKQEQSSPAKRSVGRPPKKGVASQAPLPPPAPSKRTREAVETEGMASRQQQRKRVRR